MGVLTLIGAAASPHIITARLSAYFLPSSHGHATKPLTVTVKAEGGTYLAVTIPDYTISTRPNRGLTEQFTFRDLPTGVYYVVVAVLDAQERILDSRPINGTVTVVE